MSRKADIISTVILFILLFVGLSVMSYPSFSNWWNRRVQSRVVAGYQQKVAELDNADIERMLEEARAYNNKLAAMSNPFSESAKMPEYYSILDVSGTGVMGYVTIPCINVELPLYHGTSAEVLNIAAGHLEGSAFPVGGNNTHAVISAHRGLPSAKLFTDLNKLVVNDIFTITILNEVFTYEVEDILIVEPSELDKLAIIPDGDYVTLMTCTPYGINSHRLLVRSHRIETIYEHTVKVDPDALKVDSMLVVPFIAAPFVIILVIFWFFSGSKGKMRTRKDYLNLVSPLKEVD
ncbi:MAG: class C sortase [Ruminococcus sp.]|nr:class C sortase [Ruminococcus sp.]